MDAKHIEYESRVVLAEIWKHRVELTGNQKVKAIDLLEPAYAAEVLGIQLIHVNTLSSFAGAGFEAAGFLDREGKQIAVADRFGYDVTRFTGSHEIGHWVLHPNELMLRERPIKGLVPIDYRRPSLELEADRFAGFFLMPRKLVTDYFVARFGSDIPFYFDDQAAYELGKGDPDSLIRPRQGQKTRALALAVATTYRGNHFPSLAQQFRVSVLSMAIQLELLGLVEKDDQ